MVAGILILLDMPVVDNKIFSNGFRASSKALIASLFNSLCIIFVTNTSSNQELG